MDNGVKGDERKTSFGAAESGVGTETDKRSPFSAARKRLFIKLSCRQMEGDLNIPDNQDPADMFESIVFSQYARGCKTKSTLHIQLR